MNLSNPISTIMTTDLVMVEPDDKVKVVKDIMEANGIHHVPVVKYGKLVGMVSKTDLFYFLKGMSYDSYEEVLNNVRLKNYTAEEIMTESLDCLLPHESIEKALELFQRNRYHAIPIIKDNDDIVGILTTFDIVSLVLKEKTTI